MSATYEDVLKRLIEERHRLSWTQKEMSKCVRMEQSNYSKVELGLRRLSYYDLKYLCETDVDVHYVYTGQKSSGQYASLFRECSYDELICYLRIIYSVSEWKYKEDAPGKWKLVFEKLKYVPLIRDNQKHYNIFEEIRHSLNYQQQKMAGLLGVDVKKLRDLENGRRLPDSELLYRIYELFCVSPTAILKDRKGMANELGILLDLLDSDCQKSMFGTIAAIHDID